MLPLICDIQIGGVDWCGFPVYVCTYQSVKVLMCPLHVDICLKFCYLDFTNV
jgi:hypothetical protein